MQGFELIACSIGSSGWDLTLEEGLRCRVLRSCVEGFDSWGGLGVYFWVWSFAVWA